jgi:two-component system, OmpR family, phosphate regulon sensor histidine kinase PhoR
MVQFENAVGLEQRWQNLQRTSDFQAALLGMAGHDLRQPLQVIQSAYEWLGSKVIAASERTRLERGERAIEKLTEQLDTLISALRLNEHTHNLKISSIELAPILSKIGLENEDDAWEKGVELRVCPTSAMVMSDAVLLEGALRNLVRNAVKYTRYGGRVLIGCRRFGDEVRIEVCDSGIGLAQEQLPRIFQAFQRVDPASADGLGIGLFVVRQTVELLGHRIEVHSIPSQGTRFTIYAQRAEQRA